MKRILLSVIMMASGLGYSYANIGLHSSVEGIKLKDNTDEIIITKSVSKQSNKVRGGMFRVKVQEIENNDFGLQKVLTDKEAEISNTKFNDDNFIYVKGRKDLVGYALQLASFSDLSTAKEYALSIAHKGDAEKRQLFIYTVKSTEKFLYKVYFGLLKSDESAREKQRVLLSLGYSPFVKEFR
jgi:hypothetical protein